MIRCYLAFGYVCSHPCPWSSTHTRAAWISAIDFFTFLLDAHLMLTDPQGSNWVPELSCPTPRTPLALPSFTILLARELYLLCIGAWCCHIFWLLWQQPGVPIGPSAGRRDLLRFPHADATGHQRRGQPVMQRHHPGWVESAWPRHLGNGTGTYKGSR